jgi:hypothetical protein
MIMRQLGWIFEPYVSARVSGRVSQMDMSEMRNVIESVCDRISRYTLGKGEEILLSTEYGVLGGGPGWSLIKENGPYARSALFNAGIKAFVSVRENPNHTYTYTLGKMSPFIHFDLEKIYHALNEAEGIAQGDSNSWGGSDIVGGSPRATGSKLAPARVSEIINLVLMSEHHK